MANYHPCSSIYHILELFAYTCPKQFLDQLDKIEYWFIVQGTPKEEQVSFAISKLSISVSEWWEELQISRLDGKCKIQSWNRVKRILLFEFIALDYCLLQQGTRLVSDYTCEFEQFYRRTYF